MTTFTGTTGDDVADASSGTLTGFSGGTVVNLQDGTGDTFNAAEGNDSIVAGAGNDVLNGGIGDDTLDGGAGNDTLNGGLGNNTYNFTVGASGFGTDTLDTVGDTAAGTNGDKVVFTDLASTDITVTRSGYDLILTDTAAPANQLKLVNYFYGNADAVSTIQFTDTTWTFSDVALLPLNLTGTATGDSLYGLNGSDTLDGSDGNDTLYGQGGNDSLKGGIGDDYLYGDRRDYASYPLPGWAEGNDTLDGGAGNDRLYGEGGNDSLLGGDGSDSLDGGDGDDTLDGGAGDDSIHGGAGDDTFNSSTGNDVLYGDSGTNTYNFAAGFGNDTIYSDSGSSAVPNSDIVIFSNIKSTDVTTDVAGGPNNWDRIITIGNDVLTLKNYYYTNSYTEWKVKEIRFSDTPPPTANHAPSGADKTVATAVNTAYTLKAADFGFADTQDTPANSLLAVKITTLPTAGSLLLNGVAVTAGQFVAAADINGNLLTFVPAQNGSGTGYASFTFQVQDDGGTANGGVNLDATPNTITVDVAAPSVNHAPDGADQTIVMAQDGTYALKTADFGFTDSDGDALQAVKIAVLPLAGSLTLNGTAVTAGQTVAVAAISAGQLVFTPAAGTSGTGYASFTFQVQDDGGTANGGIDLDPTPNTLTVDVTSPTAVNQAPAGADKTVATAQDTAYALKQADFGFTDADGNSLLALKITTLPAAGSLKLDGADVTAGQSISVTDIAAGKLVFAPAAGASGTGYASFSFQVQDDGGTANGGVDLDPSANTITFDVTVPTAPNQAPAGTDKTVATQEDHAYVLGTGDFGFSDSDGHALRAVQITTLPAHGSLLLENAPVSAGQSVTVADIGAGKLSFVPAENANGMPYDSFTFQVQDTGGTANGGVDLDPTANTLTVNVDPVNDAPLLALPLANHAESAGQTFSYTLPDNTFTDGDAGDSLSLAAKLADGSPLPDWLHFDGATRTFSGTAPATAGSISIRVTATDTSLATAEGSFTWVTSATAIGTEATDGDDLLAGSKGHSDRFDGLGGNDAAVLNDRQDRFTDSGSGSDFDVAVVTVPMDYRLGNGVEGLVYAALPAGSAPPHHHEHEDRDYDLKGSGDRGDNVIGVYGDDLLDVLTAKGVDLYPLFDDGGPASPPEVDPSLRFFLDGKAGNDILFGGAGDDILVGGDSGDELHGGKGNDIYYLKGANANLDGIFDTGGNDTLVMDAAPGGAAIQLTDEIENVVLKGRNNLDATGNSLDNRLAGNSGVNHLIGDAGNDILLGGNSGFKPNDILEGGDGSDVYAIVGKKFDIREVASPLDIDTVTSEKINIDLSQLSDGGINLEQVVLAGSRSLKAVGSDANNVIFGNSGNNQLEGRDGDDLLFGAAGNDKLKGGDGADGFLFDGSRGTDLVLDFTTAVDKILLDGERFAVLDANGDGQVDDGRFVSGDRAKPQDGDDYLIYDTRSGILWFDSDGNGSGKASKIAVFGHGHGSAAAVAASDVEVSNVGVAELASQWLASVPVDV